MRIVCVICTEIFVVNSHISAVNCGHIFHEDCLSKWLNSGQKTCPQCRCNASSKTIIKKLYLTESDERSSSKTGQQSFSDGPLSTTQLTHQNDDLLNEIAILREELKEKQTQLQLKSNVIEQRDSQLKELEASNKNLKKHNHELASLKDFFKGELKAFEKIKDDMSLKEKRITELESRLTSYRWVEMIYNDHETAFLTEMRKLSSENKSQYDGAFVQELVRCNVVLKDHSNKLAEEKRQLRKKYFNLEKQLNLKDKNLIDKEAELEKLREEMKNLEIQYKNDNNKRSNLQKDILKRNYHSDSPLVVCGGIIDDSITTCNTPNAALTSKNDETAALLLSNGNNNKKRKNPFAKFDLNNDEEEGKEGENDDDCEFFTDNNNKQIKLTDLSRLCYKSKQTTATARTINEIMVSDNEDENKDKFHDDVLVVKPIEHKKFGFKTKSASSLTDKPITVTNTKHGVYQYVYDGLGGHRKLLNSGTTTTTNTITSSNSSSSINKNLSKFKVTNTKSPFLK